MDAAPLVLPDEGIRRFYPVVINGSDGKVLWACELVEGQLIFHHGDHTVDESAAALFEYVMKKFVDDYILEKWLELGRK